MAGRHVFTRPRAAESRTPGETTRARPASCAGLLSRAHGPMPMRQRRRASRRAPAEGHGSMPIHQRGWASGRAAPVERPRVHANAPAPIGKRAEGPRAQRRPQAGRPWEGVPYRGRPRKGEGWNRPSSNYQWSVLTARPLHRRAWEPIVVQAPASWGKRGWGPARSVGRRPSELGRGSPAAAARGRGRVWNRPSNQSSVELRGIEPLTFALPVRRSPS